MLCRTFGFWGLGVHGISRVKGLWFRVSGFRGFRV